MIDGVLVGALEFAKVLIAFFVTMYAYYFLNRSVHYEERKPWEFLFIAAIMLFTAQLLTNLQLIHSEWAGSRIIDSARRFIEFLFFGFLLFSFIYQHNLIQKRHLLVITQAPRQTWFDRLMVGIQREPRDRPHDDRSRHEKRLDKELDELGKEEEAVPEPTPLAEQDESDEDQELLTPTVEEEPDSPTEEDERLTPEQEQLKQTGEHIVATTEELIINHLERIPPERRTIVRAQLSELKEALRTEPFDAARVKTALHELTR